MLSLTPFEELTSMLDKLEKIVTPGYNRTYYETRVKQAISNFEGLGFFKYIFCAPRYRQLIAKAKTLIAKA